MNRARRTYWVHASSGHHKVTVSIGDWRSSARIRQFVLIMFRKIFGGRAPTEHWHVDGNMAEARDLRGNCVYVDQINDHPAHVASRAAYERFRQRGPLALLPWKEAA